MMNHTLCCWPRDRVAAVILVACIVGALVPASVTRAAPPTAAPLPFADSAFERLWVSTDAPVEAGNSQRTWVWGPSAFVAAREPYAEGVGGERLVQYFDKSRMELTYPLGDRTAKWFVTNGLLVREMVSGQLQLGDDQYRLTNPSNTAVAGDRESPDAPTYAALRPLTTIHGDNRALDRTGALLDQAVNVGGRVREIKPRDDGDDYRLAYFDTATGHNVLGAFWTYLNDDVAFDRLFVLGHPISEPYWIKVRLQGKDTDVVVQLFERRVLTYTPSNEARWRVEMGNIGQHYWFWRSQGAVPLPLVTTEPSLPGQPVKVKGFNWPLLADMRVAVVPPATGLASVKPNAETDSYGSFELTLPWTGAVAADYGRSGDDLLVVAMGPSGELAAAPALLGNSLVERVSGTVSDVSRATRQIALRLPSGVVKRLNVGETAVVRTAAGKAALLADIGLGMRLEAKGRPGAAGSLNCELVVFGTS